MFIIVIFLVQVLFLSYTHQAVRLVSNQRDVHVQVSEVTTSNTYLLRIIFQQRCLTMC